METTQTTFKANLLELPIMKNHYGNTQIDTIAKKVETFSKGDKNLAWFIKLALIGGIGYLTWVYVLPQVFIMLGQWVSLAVTAAFILLMIRLAPAFNRWTKVFAKNMLKKAIKQDPFGELARERVKLVNCLSTVRASKGNINQLRQEMEAEAKRCEIEATEGQSALVRLSNRINKLKEKLTAMIAEKGEAVKNEDEYVLDKTDYENHLNESARVQRAIEKSKQYVQKYGSRGNIMKQVGHKLLSAENGVSQKIIDFDITVNDLKQEFRFADLSNKATTAAKSALSKEESWQLEYATNIITSTISADIAMTIGNLKDIDALTVNRDLDSDELYDNLSQAVAKIKDGNDVVPNAKQYTKEDYRLTSNDKSSAGSIGDMF